MYDVKANPRKYVLKLCWLVEDEAGVCFMPTRRSNVPCSVKMDTEYVAQIFLNTASVRSSGKLCLLEIGYGTS